mmetsp:Transcript_60521/g.132493  ORF Transcript_60521/g.132493 Transcript_60521/m.132493 type:complete len:88 (-) Transcript_60521:515-778(-)
MRLSNLDISTSTKFDCLGSHGEEETTSSVDAIHGAAAQPIAGGCSKTIIPTVSAIMEANNKASLSSRLGLGSGQGSAEGSLCQAISL